MKLHNVYLLISTFLLVLLASCTKPTVMNEKLNLTDDWKIQQSTKVKESGKDLTSGSLPLESWYPAKIPTTVMGVLIEAGLYPDIMVGTNMKTVDRAPFESSWWFRKEFDLPVLNEGQVVNLEFEGISYRANIWLNGEQIASSDEIFGPFRQFSLDVTTQVKEKNILAVEVFRAQGGDPNIGFVDWNPRPADESMGIFREVFVNVTGLVKMNHTAVKSRVNTESLDEAWLTIETELVNFGKETVNGNLIGDIEGVSFSYPVSLAADEKKTVKITSDEVKDLYIKNPRLWWCNNLGNPEMYSLNLRFEDNRGVSDNTKVKFGIRELEDYFTDEGFRGFILNGKKVLVKSAGWTDRIFLDDTDLSNEIQVKYVKDMNLNSIRFENIWGKSQQIYDLCDEYGLLALVGWSCQWEWDSYLGSPVDQYGGIITESQMDVVAKSFRDQILWLRNHPSIIAWYVGSDMIPRPELEKRYMKILAEIDTRPYVASAARDKSELTGPTGMKMAGPYEYVGPVYWYEDRQYGGAYGFNTETGIGVQMPVLESLSKFIPADKLWPLNDNWDYHCTTSTTAMNSLQILNEVMEAKYGRASGLEEYILKAQVIDYEGTRAMFEAFRSNIPNTTGIVQWMLNSAWPSLYWQLYDYYLVPTAGYYGVKKANVLRQLIYNYKENAIYAVNESIDEPLRGIATIQVYSMDSRLILEKEVELDVAANSAQKIEQLPLVNENVFLSLKLKNNDNSVFADNFYWLASGKDEFDWKKTNWVHTPATKYASQKALNNIPKADVKLIINKDEAGKLVVEVKNESSVIAFFTQMQIKDQNGEILLPVEWSDNYISLFPNEAKLISCKFDRGLLEGKKLSLSISGWNIEKQVVEL